MNDFNKILKFAQAFEDQIFGNDDEDLMSLPDSSTTRERIVSIAESQLGETDWEKYLQGTVNETPVKKPSWCGIFALWVLHQAGVGGGIGWEWGKGFLYKLPRTKNPKPGDIAYIDQPYQHHAIVKSVKGNQITTIDGNSTGSVVAEQSRPKGNMAFFSISPLIGERDIA